MDKLEQVAKNRGIGIQLLIRAVVIPDWLLKNNESQT